MISVKEAAALAIEFGMEVFNKAGTVEEVEVQGKNWLITLGFEQPKPVEENVTTMTAAASFLNTLGLPKTEKYYKTFKIDGEKKEVLSAKIHQL